MKRKKKKKIHESQLLTGTVDHVNKRFCFVVVNELNEDIRVLSRNMNGAIHEDLVKLKLLNKHSKRYIEGEIINVLERKNDKFIGTIEDSMDFAFFIPKNKKIYTDFFIKKKRSEKYSNKKKYLAKVYEWKTKRKPEAKIIKCLGNIGENETEISSIIHDFNLPVKFPESVINETKYLNEIISEKEIKKRKDLRNVLTFTIDPNDAKDFDDALSIEFKKDGFSIGIHIADVSHFFNKRNKINEEAEKRGTSVYLVDRTIPMLPEVLSNNLCSLKPNEDRLTFSVIFQISKY